MSWPPHLYGKFRIPENDGDAQEASVTVGTVEFDERGQRAVAARVKGRIDKLYVNQTGQTVNKGDPLALLYSPDLVVTDVMMPDGPGDALVSALRA